MVKKRSKDHVALLAKPSLVFPCDLPTWPTVEKLLLEIQAVESTDEMVNIMLKIHNLCNISVETPDSSNHRQNPVDLLDDFRFIIDRQFSPQQRLRFITKTLPCMAKYAICLSELKPTQNSSRQFSLSCQGQETCMSLDRRFVASLIANAFFFSTFPVRASCLAPPLSDLSFGALFHNVGSSFVQGMRLKNLLNYFDTLNEEEPCGRIVYSRFCSRNMVNSNKINQSSEARKSLVSLEQSFENVKERKPLSPVFVMADARVVDIQNNVSELVICHFSPASLLDGTTNEVLQHPEVLVALMFIEQTMPEEWLKISGILTSRIILPPLTAKNQQQICLLDRPQGQDDDEELSCDESAHPLMLKELWRYLQCLQETEAKEERQQIMISTKNDEGSCTASSKSSRLDRLADRFSSHISINSDKEEISTEKKQQSVPDRKFSERLRAALERGNTPESSSEAEKSNRHATSKEGMLLERDRRVIQMDQDKSEFRDRDSEIQADSESEPSLSGDSSYSFDFGFDVDSEYEEVLQDWMALPQSLTVEDLDFHAARNKNRKMITKKLAGSLRRRALSESMCDVTWNLDLLSDGIKCSTVAKWDKIKSGSCFFTQFCSTNEKCSSKNINGEENGLKVNCAEEIEKPCLWIVSQTPDIDPSRFLVQWLAASLYDIPLVMYQTRLAQSSPDDGEDDFGADIVASICAGVEERGWDAKQLLHALLDGGKHSLFDTTSTSIHAKPDGA